MPLATQLSADTVSDRDTHWEAQQRCFEADQATFSWYREDDQRYRDHFPQLHILFEQECQVYQQEQAYLWEKLRARRQMRGEDEQPLHIEQQLRLMMEDFSDTLTSLRRRFASDRQAFRHRLNALCDERVRVRGIEDPIQRHKAYQQIHEQCQQVRAQLREAKNLLREQQETYRQLRLDYQAVRAQLRAEKAVIEQKQEARRWQGYGYS